MAETKRGSFVHIEITSTDPERTRKFFEDVFDWKFDFMPEMEYSTYMPRSGPGGGLMKPMGSNPPGVLNYLLVDDLDADVGKVERAGGRILQPKMEIPGVGWWALFQEPTGIVLALFEPKMPPPTPRPARRARSRRAPARRATKRRSKGRGRKK